MRLCSSNFPKRLALILIDSFFAIESMFVLVDRLRRSPQENELKG
jgi:hypothetical protein